MSSSALEPAPAENRVLAGRYRLRRVVGRGGMGVLWAATDEMLGREVAVKEVRAPLDAAGREDEIARERGLREARAAARVTHPSAVTVYDVVEDGGRPWIVMELLPSRTLADVLATEGPLTPADAARVGLDLLDALAAAHQVGVLHRDVKPGNVLFADGRAVLVDFGIAVVDGDPALTSSGQLLGSPAFMAPERARGEQPSAASDLWSLGATLFTAVQGDSPFRRDGQLPTLAAVVTQDAPLAANAGPLRPLIAALLARDPADRPSADEARAQLVDALAASSGDATQPVDVLPVPVAAGPEPTRGPDDEDATVEAAVAALLADTGPDPRIPDEVPVAAGPRPLLPTGLLVPRPRRAGALAAALLTPVTLFALAMGWPGGGSSPIMRPRAEAPASATATPAPASTAHTRTARPPSTVVSGAQLRTVAVVTSAKPHGKGHRHGDHKRESAGKDGHKGHAHGGKGKAPKHGGKD